MSKKRIKSRLEKVHPQAAHRPDTFQVFTVRWLWIARGSLALAGVVAAYLLQHAFALGPLGGCGPGSDCDRVLGTSWAYWLSIPVSALALLAYLALLGITFGLAPVASPRFRAGAWFAALAISVAIPLSAGWFAGVQALVLHAFCKFCLAAHGLAVAGAVSLWCAAWKELRPGPAGVAAPKFPRLMLVAGTAGLIAVGILAAGQTLFPHRMNLVQLHQGTIRLDRRDLPCLGPADAPHVIVSLFDYTCPDCRDLHRLLREAQQRSAEPLAILALPVPLDPGCNSAVRRALPKHTNACEFARLALAVRHADAAAFEKLDDWLFEQPKLPGLDQARAKAAEWVGEEVFRAALTNRWVETTLQTGVRLYLANQRTTRSLRMPQLMIGEAVSVGPLRNVEDLLGLLEKNLPGYRRKR